MNKCCVGRTKRRNIVKVECLWVDTRLLLVFLCKNNSRQLCKCKNVSIEFSFMKFACFSKKLKSTHSNAVKEFESFFLLNKIEN